MTRRELIGPLNEAGAEAVARGEDVVTGVTVGDDGVTRAIVGDHTTGRGRAVDLGR